MTVVAGMVMWVKLTAYSASCAGCSGVMADGRVADHRLGVVASSKAWPLGTCLVATMPDGSKRSLEVADRLGPNTRRKAGADTHLDLLVSSQRVAKSHGVKRVRVEVVPCR